MSRRRPKRRARRTAGGALLAAVAAAGCGADAVIDHVAAQIAVREGFEELGVRVRSVECPADVEAERGEAYACVAETSRGRLRVVYRQLDEEGTVGRPSIERVEPGG